MKSIATSTAEIRRKKMEKFRKYEDEILQELVCKYGQQWDKISKEMNNRTKRQCRERYIGYLSPDLKSTIWTTEEDEFIRNLYEKIGGRWVEIARMLPGRSGDQVRNRWHQHLKKFDEYFPFNDNI
jgi:hypothetical protein